MGLNQVRRVFRSLSTLFLLFIVSFCCFLAVLSFARTVDSSLEKDPSVVHYGLILLDCSESMDEKMEGISRLEQAKIEIATLVQSKPEFQWALITIGNNRTESPCSDVVLRIPFTYRNSDILLDELNRCSIGNKTPLALGMFHAYQYLLTVQGKGNVYLFTDGYDNCGGDPIQVANLFSQETFGLFVFAIQPGESIKNLSTMVKSTGGSCLKSESIQDLSNQIQMVIRNNHKPFKSHSEPPELNPISSDTPIIEPSQSSKQIQHSKTQLTESKAVRESSTSKALQKKEMEPLNPNRVEKRAFIPKGSNVPIRSKDTVLLFQEASEVEKMSITKEVYSNKVHSIWEPSLVYPQVDSPKMTITVPPVLLSGSRIKPDYPVLAKRYGMEGVVKLQIDLDEKGNVIHTKVVVSSGFPILDDAAQEAALQWTFSPALSGEVPIPYQFLKTIIFKIKKDLP